jgi:hypothetical protein
MNAFFVQSRAQRGNPIAKRFLEGSAMNPKNIGNSKPFFLKSRAQWGLPRAFFARWGGQRGTPIAKKVLEALL